MSVLVKIALTASAVSAIALSSDSEESQELQLMGLSPQQPLGWSPGSQHNGDPCKVGAGDCLRGLTCVPKSINIFKLFKIYG